MGNKMCTIKRRELFEVAILEDGKQQEVVCPKCGEHYLYPVLPDDENAEQ